jgi:hypothetical protein
VGGHWMRHGVLLVAQVSIAITAVSAVLSLTCAALIVVGVLGTQPQQSQHRAQTLGARLACAAGECTQCNSPK